MSAMAKPITLQFEAEVGIFINHDMIDIGIDVMVGDRITGQFSFEPASGSNGSNDGGYSEPVGGGGVLEVHQPFSSSLEINGVSLATSSFFLKSFNNSITVCDCGPGTLVDPSGTFDVLEASGQIEATVPNISSERSSWRLELKGREAYFIDSDGVLRTRSVFEVPELPSDVSKWNALRSRRKLNIYLGNQSGQGVYLQANVGDFQIVPEPNTFGLSLMLGVACTLLRKRKQA